MFTVGSIVGTHGLRGEVRVLSRTDFPHLRFVKGSVLTMQGDHHSEARVVHVRSARSHKNIYIVGFEEVTSIEEAEKYRGKDLLVTREQLPELSEGHYFVRDLIGSTVVSDDGEFSGKLVDVLSPGANDVYVVKTAGGTEVLLPAIPDCILAVDIENKKITVHLMPGLLD